MTSTALVTWDAQRRERIDQLYTAHRAVGGTSRGRRTATEQLNWSLAIRIAGEFQGYARDLHDECISALLARISCAPAVRSTLQLSLTLDRRLDKGNATRSNLQQDYLRIGIPILNSVKNRYTHGQSWLDKLDRLLQARNGIAHSDPGGLATALGGATNLRLLEVKAWDSAMRQLARAMDVVASSELATLTGGSRPW